MPIARLTHHLGLIILALLTMIGLTAATPARAASPPVIALLTDYGNQDPYVSQLKGVILTINPDARILDLTHEISPFNIAEGAYLLDQCSAEFPAGTIFVGVVDPQVGTERDAVLLETKRGTFFVGPDNGLFTQVVDHQGILNAWKLDKPQYFRPGATSHTFHGRDVFGPIAAHLAAGVDPDKLGTPIKTFTMLPVKEPTFANGTISVGVLHIDRYGNIILNLDRDSEAAGKLKEGNLVKISFGKQTASGPLMKAYGDIEKGRLILLYGGNNLLEIAMNQGSAAKELKIQPGDIIFLKP